MKNLPVFKLTNGFYYLTKSWCYFFFFLSFTSSFLSCSFYFVAFGGSSSSFLCNWCFYQWKEVISLKIKIKREFTYFLMTKSLNTTSSRGWLKFILNLKAFPRWQIHIWSLDGVICVANFLSPLSKVILVLKPCWFYFPITIGLVNYRSEGNTLRFVWHS